MPQITANSNDLVRKAYQLIRIIDDNDTLTATQLQTGIDYLNYIVSFDEQKGARVPYSQLLEFPLVGGQARYVISDNVGADVASNPILDIVNACIILSGNVRWPLQVLNDDQYYNNIRPQTTTGQPFYLFFQQSNTTALPNAGFVELWPVPNQTYTLSIYCKLSQNTFTAATTIDAPGWYLEYLEYSLAYKLGERYKIGIWDQRQQARYDELRSFLFNNSDQDYTVQPSPALIGSTWVPLSSNQPFP